MVCVLLYTLTLSHHDSFLKRISAAPNYSPAVKNSAKRHVISHDLAKPTSCRQKKQLNNIDALLNILPTRRNNNSART